MLKPEISFTIPQDKILTSSTFKLSSIDDTVHRQEDSNCFNCIDMPEYPDIIGSWDKNKFMSRNHLLKETPDKPQGTLSNIRGYLYEKYEIWDFIDLFPYRWRMYYWDHIKTIFKPCNQRIRKSIPRTWKDISHLMVDVNFEFIKAFYEDEYSKDIVDWTGTEHHKEFAEWLELSYKWITQRRPQLQIDLDNAYPPCRPIGEMLEPIEDEDGRKMFKMVNDGIPYDVKYAEVNRIEKVIEDKDTEILTEFVRRREYFWT